jgi:hypothetical protein
MNTYLSNDFGISGPSFGVEVSGALSGGVNVNTGLIGMLVQAVALITSEPVKKVAIHLIEFRAEIRIVSDRADRYVRVMKFRSIAEVYNQELLRADRDGIPYFSPELKEVYMESLKKDYLEQFRRLLNSG